VIGALRDFLVEHDELADLDPAQRRLELRRLLSEEDSTLSLSDVVAHIDGFGPLTHLMSDPDVTDVLVNGHDEVWVERSGSLWRTDVRFHDEDSLRALLDRLLGEAGASADISHPIADARLRDGSRLHVVLPPIAPAPLVSIRRLPSVAPSLDELVRRSALTAAQADSLMAEVAAGSNIAISGATGTGKTTLLGSLLALVPERERIVVLEETRELPAVGGHVVSLLTRLPNAEGAGGIDLADLVRASLRMRPDRLVIGEVRGAEALALLAALNTGHTGSLVTVHASSTGRVVDRLVSLALHADGGPSESTIRAEAESVFDVFVHLERDGEMRRVVDIRTR
jgi:pilus assembly protein CpaF